MKLSGYWCSSELVPEHTCSWGHSPGSGAHFSELVFQGIHQQQKYQVSQVLHCTVFREVAEELATNVIILINTLFGFNTVASAFIWPLALGEPKDICNLIYYLHFSGLMTGHFEIFSVNRSMVPMFCLPAIGANLKQCGYTCFLQEPQSHSVLWSEFCTQHWACVPEQVVQKG